MHSTPIPQSLDVKAKIQKAIDYYVEVFPEEFEQFKKGVAISRAKQRTKFAEAKGTDFVQRRLYEVPSTLWGAFRSAITDEELRWLQSKEGGRWFAKKYPVFRVTEKV